MKLLKKLKTREKTIRELEEAVKILEGACRDWERTVEMLLENRKSREKYIEEKLIDLKLAEEMNKGLKVVNKSLEEDLIDAKHEVEFLKLKSNNETRKLRDEIKKLTHKIRDMEYRKTQAKAELEGE